MATKELFCRKEDLCAVMMLQFYLLKIWMSAANPDKAFQHNFGVVEKFYRRRRTCNDAIAFCFPGSKVLAEVINKVFEHNLVCSI